MSMRLRGLEFHRGAPSPGKEGCPCPIFDWEEEDDDSQHIIGEAAINSRPAGVACGSSSPRLRLLAAPFSTSGVSLSAALSDRMGVQGTFS